MIGVGLDFAPRKQLRHRQRLAWSAAAGEDALQTDGELEPLKGTTPGARSGLRLPLPVAALAAIRAVGRACLRLSRRYQAELSSVFPDLSGRALRSAARELEVNRFTREAMRRLAMRSGWSFLPDLVTVTGEDALLGARARGPAIVVAWHAGFGAALLAGLHRLGQDGIVVRGRPDVPLLGFSTVVSSAPVPGRAAVFWTILRQLRSGGLAVLFIDARTPPRASLERSPVLFDRRVELPRGPAALCRLAGAPIVCAESRWTGGTRAPFHVHLEPLPPPADSESEAALTQRLGSYFEARLRAAPSNLWPLSLGQLAAAPRRAQHPTRSDA